MSKRRFNDSLLSRRCCGGPILAVNLLCVGLGVMFMMLSAMTLGLVFVAVGTSTEALCFLMGRSRCSNRGSQHRAVG